jgi:peptidoglycan/xylan/chitin deacetylase (PgdA/CDA1 family)
MMHMQERLGSSRPIPILMYHQIDLPAPRGTSFRSLTVHPRNFKRQMYWMHRFGYRGLSMRDLMPYLKGERSGKVFGITFDDGYRNVYQHALPVLTELGFTSTNYLVANQFGGGNFWDSQNNVPFSPLMSQSEARAWIQAGQEVGSHTLDHVHLPELSFEEARYQISHSRRVLSDALQEEVTAFCYPYGQLTTQHADMVFEAGYQNATTTQRGLANSDDSPFLLPRVGVWRSTPILRFFQKCFTRYEDRRRG